MARFDRTIPPGGEGNITLEIRTKGFQGEMHKTARVTSNDPKQPQVTISMKGKVWAPVYVNPRYVRLRGTEEEEVKGVVRLRGEKEEPFVANLASNSIPDKVEAQLRETEKGRTYELEVKNRIKAEARYSGNLKVTTNYPEKPEIVIQISGDIRGNLEVRPRAVNFGRITPEWLEQSKNHPRGRARAVTVILNKGDDLKIEKVELDKSLFKVSTNEIKPGQMIQILIEPVLEKLEKGANQDLLRICTNQKTGGTLEVPIRLDLP